MGRWLNPKVQRERDDLIVQMFRRGIPQRKIAGSIGTASGIVSYVLKKRGLR